MGAGHAEMLAQELNQQRARLDLAETGLPLTVMATEMVMYSSPSRSLIRRGRAAAHRHNWPGLSQAVHRPVKRIAEDD